MSTLWGNSAPPGKPEKVGHPGVVTKVNRKGLRKKDQNHRRRTKRGGDWLEEVHTHHHGGMDFPSAEAALLTISFLTFAVFLIKLVLVSAHHTRGEDLQIFPVGKKEKGSLLYC